GCRTCPRHRAAFFFPPPLTAWKALKLHDCRVPSRAEPDFPALACRVQTNLWYFDGRKRNSDLDCDTNGFHRGQTTVIRAFRFQRHAGHVNVEFHARTCPKSVVGDDSNIRCENGRKGRCQDGCKERREEWRKDRR